jgi:hypothetical protein
MTTKTKKPRKTRAKPLKQGPEPAIKAEPTQKHEWCHLADGFESCVGCSATRKAGSSNGADDPCPGRPPDLRGHLYKIDGLVAALARQVNELHDQHEPIGDLTQEGHLAVSDLAWPAVVLVEQLQGMLKTAGEMVDKLEA